MKLDKKLLFGGTLMAVATVAALGGSMINALQTRAAETSASDITTAQVQNATPIPNAEMKDPSKATHVGSNGVKEELLTGDTAEKVTAAALAAVPGGTVERVETDAEGSPYEAHMRTADGARVTVKFDSNFQVTSSGSDVF